MSSTKTSTTMRAWDDPRVVFPDEETWARLSPTLCAAAISADDAGRGS